MREREAADAATAEPTATRALPAPGPARLLQLQRTAGNRAVGRVLARYEAGEHVQFDILGHNVPVAGLSGIDERYIVAMGDYYKSPEAFMNAKADELKDLIALIDRDEKARTGKGGTSPTEDEWQKWSEKWRPKGERYMDLNKINESHFAPRNKARWEELHKQALKEAQASGNGSGAVSSKARIVNAFAAHYLTDAFAAGHMIDKVAVKEAAKKSLGTGKNRENLAKAVAKGIIGNGECVKKLSDKEIKDKALGGDWGPPTEPRLASLLDSVMYWNEKEFLSLFARIAHDDLNAAIGKGRGLWVANKAGDRWQLSGDATLIKSSRTLDIARKAVKAADDNLTAAAKVKSPPAWKIFTPALDDATIKGFFDNVWQYVPVPTTTSLPGEGTETGDAQVKAAVAKYTNAAHGGDRQGDHRPLDRAVRHRARADAGEGPGPQGQDAADPPDAARRPRRRRLRRPSPSRPSPSRRNRCRPSPVPPTPTPTGARLHAPRFMLADGKTPDPTLQAVLEDRARLHGGSPRGAVAKVQSALIDAGYDVGPEGADGIYGGNTAKAVKKFKHDEHLGFEEFGDVGPGTMRRLDEKNTPVLAPQ